MAFPDLIIIVTVFVPVRPKYRVEKVPCIDENWEPYEKWMHVPDVAEGSSILKCQDQGGDTPCNHLKACHCQPNDLVNLWVVIPN